VYKDNSLLPREAVRLAALGILASGSMTYAALAAAVRNFTSRIAGPSLDLMGTSIELLRFEGLVSTEEAESEEIPDAVLTLTEDGRTELTTLLQAAVRPPVNDVAKLILALKFRFLHFLETKDQNDQVDMMIEACEGELARLVELRAQHSEDPGYLIEWLDHDLGQIEDRLEWLRGLKFTLAQN
tara:strand:+ start:42005 stop:42556 length:552 start_codon:yes stop_codon:yes gene_type:complete